MAKVQVNNVVVLDNPSPFYNPFQFEITFECIEDLSEDLEWKIIYVGSAESEEYDQVLDSVLVGPVPAGRHMFVFQADAPNPGLIPDADAVGVTVVLITCTYRGQEFIRVGYYVNNEYTETELRENPPVKPDFSKVIFLLFFFVCFCFLRQCLFLCSFGACPGTCCADQAGLELRDPLASPSQSFKEIFWHLIPESQDSTLTGKITRKNWKMQRAVTQIYSPFFQQMHYHQHQKDGPRQKTH